MDLDQDDTSQSYLPSTGNNKFQTGNKKPPEQVVSINERKHRNIDISAEFPMIKVNLKNDPKLNWKEAVVPKMKHLGAEKETKKISFSKPTYQESSSKFLTQSTNKPTLMTSSVSLNSELESIIKMMCTNTQSSKLNSQGVLFQEGNLEEACKKFKCNRCKKILIKSRLSCGHATCFYCLKSSVSKLISDQSLENLKKCRCKECLKLLSHEDVEKLFNNSPDIDTKAYKELRINKTCVWCKRTLNVMVEYATELECLHMCRECYSVEAFSGAQKCILCQDPFKKLEYSKKTILKCKSCQCLGNQIKDGFWALHLDHHVCLQCAGQIKNNCLVCGMQMTKHEKNLFVNFINKYCIICSESKHMAEFNYCKKCANFACHSCAGSKYCLRCG